MVVLVDFFSAVLLLQLARACCWYWCTFMLGIGILGMFFSFLNDQLKKLVSCVFLYAVKF